MQQVILTLVFLFSSIVISNAQESEVKNSGTIKVLLVNALSDKGSVHFAFFDKENFRKQPLFSKTATIENGSSNVTFENVPFGEYAIICFHDENENDKLDFQVSGMPLESYGTSNNALSFGPPQFEDAKFIVGAEPLSLEIKF
jgi:uncharacterized protein (DUF2141 family)